MLLKAQTYLPKLFFGLGILFLVAAFFARTNVTTAFILGALGLMAAAIAMGRALEEAYLLRQANESREAALEQEVAGERDAFAVLTEALPTAIFTLDTRPIIIRANARAREMFQFAEPSGRTLLAVTLSADLEMMVTQAIQSREVVSRELMFPYPKESIAQAEAWFDPQTQQAFLTLYEITDLRKLERIRQDFVANVSHELRTPLTLIRLMAETMQSEPEDTELRERYLQKTIDEVDRLSSIAGDLLVLSAAEGSPLRLYRCDLGSVTKGITTQMMRKATDKGLSLGYEGDNHLIIEANTAQITQVVLNLVENAINYTNSGGVVVRCFQDGPDAVLEVRDSGVGIPVEHQNRIFERFYRVDKGRSRQTGGTGLGLSIVRNIVEAHGGVVTLESALNQGSAFRVRLPVGNTDAPEEG